MATIVPDPEPYFRDDSTTLYEGDCLDVLRDIPDSSIDAVVTDPPYGLGFMGKAWDDLPPGREWAKECLRALKPGGHLLAFGGARTWHRLACAIEDAGFEIRDSIAWLYGSGFPKSLDVSKAIDMGSGENRARRLEFTAWVRATGLTERQINAVTASRMGARYLTDKTQPEIATADMFDRLRTVLPEVPERIERLVAERTGIEWSAYLLRPLVRTAFRIRRASDVQFAGLSEGEYAVTTGASDDSRAWQGWGTALKPAHEPIVVARKSLVGTVAANVLAHGTGALNIDGCRVGDVGGGTSCSSRDESGECIGHPAANGSLGGGVMRHGSGGRWPSNLVLDESQAVALDAQSGASQSRIGKPRGAANGEGWGMTATGAEYDDQGGAARFFYTAKADAGERVRVDGITHPTIKPLALMRWLVRLVTPPGGLVLEPFAGSGTTVEACILEGFRCTAIEREADYLPLIVQRINRRRDPVAAVRATDDDAGLFDLLGEASA